MRKSNVIAALFFVAVCLVSCDKTADTAEEESNQENVETTMEDQESIDETVVGESEVTEEPESETEESKVEEVVDGKQK